MDRRRHMVGNQPTQTPAVQLGTFIQLQPSFLDFVRNSDIQNPEGYRNPKSGTYFTTVRVRLDTSSVPPCIWVADGGNFRIRSYSLVQQIEQVSGISPATIKVSRMKYHLFNYRFKQIFNPKKGLEYILEVESVKSAGTDDKSQDYDPKDSDSLYQGSGDPEIEFEIRERSVKFSKLADQATANHANKLESAPKGLTKSADSYDLGVLSESLLKNSLPKQENSLSHNQSRDNRGTSSEIARETKRNRPQDVEEGELLRVSAEKRSKSRNGAANVPEKSSTVQTNTSNRSVSQATSKGLGGLANSQTLKANQQINQAETTKTSKTTASILEPKEDTSYIDDMLDFDEESPLGKKNEEPARSPSPQPPIAITSIPKQKREYKSPFAGFKEESAAQTNNNQKAFSQSQMEGELNKRTDDDLFTLGEPKNIPMGDREMQLSSNSNSAERPSNQQTPVVPTAEKPAPSKQSQMKDIFARSPTPNPTPTSKIVNEQEKPQQPISKSVSSTTLQRQSAPGTNISISEPTALQQPARSHHTHHSSNNSRTPSTPPQESPIQAAVQSPQQQTPSQQSPLQQAPQQQTPQFAQQTQPKGQANPFHLNGILPSVAAGKETPSLNKTAQSLPSDREDSSSQEPSQPDIMPKKIHEQLKVATDNTEGKNPKPKKPTLFPQAKAVPKPAVAPAATGQLGGAVAPPPSAPVVSKPAVQPIAKIEAVKPVNNQTAPPDANQQAALLKNQITLMTQQQHAALAQQYGAYGMDPGLITQQYQQWAAALGMAQPMSAMVSEVPGKSQQQQQFYSYYAQQQAAQQQQVAQQQAVVHQQAVAQQHQVAQQQHAVVQQQQVAQQQQVTQQQPVVHQQHASGTQPSVSPPGQAPVACGKNSPPSKSSPTMEALYTYLVDAHSKYLEGSVTAWKEERLALQALESKRSQERKDWEEERRRWGEERKGREEERRSRDGVERSLREESERLRERCGKAEMEVHKLTLGFDFERKGWERERKELLNKLHKAESRRRSSRAREDKYDSRKAKSKADSTRGDRSDKVESKDLSSEQPKKSVSKSQRHHQVQNIVAKTKSDENSFNDFKNGPEIEGCGSTAVTDKLSPNPKLDVSAASPVSFNLNTCIPNTRELEPPPKLDHPPKVDTLSPEVRQRAEELVRRLAGSEPQSGLVSRGSLINRKDTGIFPFIPEAKKIDEEIEQELASGSLTSLEAQIKQLENVPPITVTQQQKHKESGPKLDLKTFHSKVVNRESTKDKYKDGDKRSRSTILNDQSKKYKESKDSGERREKRDDRDHKHSKEPQREQRPEKKKDNSRDEPGDLRGSKDTLDQVLKSSENQERERTHHQASTHRSPTQLPPPEKQPERAEGYRAQKNYKADASEHRLIEPKKEVKREHRSKDKKSSDKQHKSSKHAHANVAGAGDEQASKAEGLQEEQAIIPHRTSSTNAPRMEKKRFEEYPVVDTPLVPSSSNQIPRRESPARSTSNNSSSMGLISRYFKPVTEISSPPAPSKIEEEDEEFKRIQETLNRSGHLFGHNKKAGAHFTVDRVKPEIPELEAVKPQYPKKHREHKEHHGASGSGRHISAARGSNPTPLPPSLFSSDAEGQSPPPSKKHKRRDSSHTEGHNYLGKRDQDPSRPRREVR